LEIIHIKLQGVWEKEYMEKFIKVCKGKLKKKSQLKK